MQSFTQPLGIARQQQFPPRTRDRHVHPQDRQGPAAPARAISPNRLPPPARPHRRRPRNDPRGWRQQPSRRPDPRLHPDIPVQRCRAHKIMNVLNKIRRSDREDAKRDLHDMMNAPNIAAARTAACRFADRWRGAPTRRPSNACATTPTTSPPASDTPRSTGAGGCGPRTPSNDASGRSGEEPGPWALSGTTSHGTRPLRNCLPKLQPRSPVQPRENDIGQ